MAKSFGSTKGEAIKGGEYYKWKDGDQSIRLVGDIVPRYVYWKQDKERRNISIECLSFNRDAEKFTNVEKDWFKELFASEDPKCSWAYVARAINPDDKSKTILIPLKKKMYQQIQDVAQELGDPTDPETGWDIVIQRKKTGAQAFNVEYTVKQLKCKARPLTEDELALVEKMPPIDELVPRQTAEEQKELIERLFFSDSEDTETDEENLDDVEE